MAKKNKPQQTGTGTSANGWTRLTSRDLTAFDKRAKELILNAMEQGCTGKISSRHHAILRNAAGGTTSVPRNLTSQNRTSQNCEAGVRRLLEEHAEAMPDTEAPAGGGHAQEPSTITVKEAFLRHGAAFSSWIDTLSHSLPANARIEVRDAAHGEEFKVAYTEARHSEASEANQAIRPIHADAAQSSNVEPEPRQADGSQPTPEVETTSHASQAAARAVLSVGISGADTATGPTEPTEPTEPGESGEPVSAPHQPEDAALVLERIRHALGEDPRIAVLAARVHELEQLNDQLRSDLAAETVRADEAVARNQIIRDALDL